MDRPAAPHPDFFKKHDPATRTPPDLDHILSLSVELIVALLNAERVLIALKDPGTGNLLARAGKGLDLTTVLVAGEVSTSITTEVLEKGKPIVTFDASDDSRYGEKTSVVLSGLRSALCVPLKTLSRTWGYIYVDNRKESGVFYDKHIRILQGFADWLITVMF